MKPVSTTLAKQAKPLALATLACVTLSACQASDPNAYAIPISEAKDRLGKASSEYKTETQTRYMRASGWTENGLRVSMSNSRSFRMNCELLFEEVSESATRIVPSCGDTGSATGNVAIGFVEMEAAAHVNKLLTGKPIDPEEMMRKMTVKTAKAIPKMQGEALGADAQARAMRKAQDRVQQSKGGWGESSGGGAGDGWAD
ncbi:MAG: hypothetical protein WBA51_13755 [Erythrobacter sp.]